MEADPEVAFRTMVVVLVFLFACMALSWILVRILKYRDQRRYREELRAVRALEYQTESVESLVMR